jgi:DNA-binding LacI/PurR family transcriptional regulator
MTSIKHIAIEAGVSTATVSHVINKTRFVSDVVRRRVLSVIKENNYYPNANARMLASGRSRTIGLIVSDISNPFFPELVSSIETAAYEHGYDVILANTNYETERASHYVRRFIERKVAGVAMMTSEMNRDLIQELAGRQVPVVFLDSGETGLHMSNLKVGYSHGIKEAILHFAALGHLNVAFIRGLPNLNSAERRLHAFRKTMRQVFPNARPKIYQGDFKVTGGAKAAAEMMADGPPTAVLAANDLMAFGAISEFKKAGFEVPRDVSVVGFDDIAFSTLLQPPLTTVNLPLSKLGRVAVEVLMRTVSNATEVGVETEISTALIIRGSTAVARQHNERWSKKK